MDRRNDWLATWAMSDRAANRSSGRVSILIVNFRSTALLRACLDSVSAQTLGDAIETIVVDNASPDFDVEEMRSGYPRVHFIRAPHNLAYTGGNNLAFEHAQGDYVLLLNPDTVLDPRAVENAVAHFAEHPELAAQGATMLNPDGSLQRYYHRLPTWQNIPYVLLGRMVSWLPGGRRYAMADESFDGATVVEQPPGAFVILRRSALAGGELLDGGYFNYFSDVDLCARLWDTGPIIVFSDVRCQHIRGAAGVRTNHVDEQLTLRQDLAWGVRRYFRRRNGFVRAYVGWWLVLFWVIRVLQTSLRSPRNIRSALVASVGSLRGSPPRYR